MLTIVVNGLELFDENTNEFKMLGGFTLIIEHSLFSMSKWESKFQKSFLSKESKSHEEIVGYIEAMIVSGEYPEDWWKHLSSDTMYAINAYIDSPQSATTFGRMPEHTTRGRSETITSELIYYWMVAFNIPFECEHWHLNRLFALIKICNIKNSKPSKRSKGEIAQSYRELNAQRRAQLGTSG